MLAVYLNGQDAGSVQDDAIAEAGSIRLVVSRGQHIVVRSVLVTEPSAQEAVPLAPAPQPTPVPVSAATPAPTPSPEPVPPTPVPAAPAAPPAGSWREFTSLEGGFSVSLPDAGTPISQDATTNTPAGPIVRHSFTLFVQEGDSRAGYDLIYIDYPATVVQSVTSAVLLQGVRDSVVAQSDGKVLSESPMTVAGFPGLDSIAELRGGGVYTRMRVLLVNQRVYITAVSTPNEEISFEKVTRFLDSFKLVTPPTP